LNNSGELLVSGYLRSGTTLAANILAQDEAVSMLPQAFPLLFVEAKRRFLRDVLGDSAIYPLGHLFGEDRYSNDDLVRYLGHCRLERDELASIFDSMAGYEGQWTRFAPAQREEVLSTLRTDGGFANLLRQLLHRFAVRPRARWFGCKELACEELFPFLLVNGFRCLLMLRDPRDVVASLNYGRRIGGATRPTLFTIRAWRKSVAFALTCEASPGFRWYRYEDLATDPQSVVTDASAMLDLDASGFDFSRLVDATGAEWRGNSSHREHRGVSAASVGSFRDLLPPHVSAFVEAACLPEFHLLGYESPLTRSEASRVIRDFQDPYQTRPGLESDEASPANALLEVERLERVTSSDERDSSAWFVSPIAHRRLRSAFRG
jgi:hypothetical protein